MECNVYHRHDYGGFLRRYFADFFDGILLGILLTVISVSAIPEELSLILVILTILAYMIGFKFYRGATPGYQILGMKIIAINGAEVTVKQLLVRLISSFFSALAFGLGFIWIAFDKNKQSWHDKIAGTYIVRANAKPVQTVEISRASLVRTRLFALVVLAPFVIFTALIGGVIHITKSSDAYQLLEQFIRSSPWVQQEVGNSIKFGVFPSGNVSTSGEFGEADFSIHVSGDKGEVTVTVLTVKMDKQWVITKAGYTGKDGYYIDITKPYVNNRNSSDFFQPPGTLWTRTYGGSNGDRGRSVQQTSDGGFIVVGETYSFGAGMSDVWLIRTDPSGETLWTRTYGGTGLDAGWSVQETADGGFIVTGRTESFGSGGSDAWLIRTDAQGNTVWTRTYGGSNDDRGRSVQQTSDGGFIVAGITSSFSTGYADVWLIRTDASGDTLWTRTYGGRNYDWGESVQQTSDGGFIVTGMTAPRLVPALGTYGSSRRMHRETLSGL